MGLFSNPVPAVIVNTQKVLSTRENSIHYRCPAAPLKRRRGSDGKWVTDHGVREIPALNGLRAFIELGTLSYPCRLFVPMPFTGRWASRSSGVARGWAQPPHA